MRVRAVCFVFICAGCESLHPAPVAQTPVPQNTPIRVAAPIPQPPPPAAEVLRAAATQPPAPTPAPPTAPPEEEDSLTLAAKCLAQDDVRGAVLHLDAYVRTHPDQPLFRLQLAELHLRGGQQAEAKFQYERFAADAQESPALQPHLVTAHIKLMEIAQRRNDRFGELFHRGVGLLLLVKEQDNMKDRDEVFCEEMLCKSLRALLDAKELKPRDPRVRVYLAEVHARAGNPHAADAERVGARTSVVSGELTPTERQPVLFGE